MAVRFKLDENLPRDAVALLRDAGHDVDTVLAEQLGGKPDAEILAACTRENRTLITFDLDFSDIRLHPPENYRGIWVLRPALQSIGNTLGLLRRALSMPATEPIDGKLWIVEPDRVRIRG